MFSAASVCLFVSQHDNFRMSKHRMMEHCTKISAEFEFGGQTPWVRIPRNVALGYDVGKISAGCLVFCVMCAFLGAHVNNKPILKLCVDHCSLSTNNSRLFLKYSNILETFCVHVRCDISCVSLPGCLQHWKLTLR